MSIVECSDGGFLAAGYGYTADGPLAADVYLVKLDQNGQMLWDRHIDNSEVDEAMCAKETADGGFLVVGSTKGRASCRQALDCSPQVGKGSRDLLVLRTDRSGMPLWTRVVGRDGYIEMARSVVVREDGAPCSASRP